MIQPLDGFVGGAYLARSIAMDAQRCINWYPELSESGSGKTQSMLLPTPGLKQFALIHVNGGGARGNGLFTTATGRMFYAAGDSLFETNVTGTLTLIGALLTNDGPLSMSENGTILFIVDGAHYYTMNLSTNVFAVCLDGFLIEGTATHIGYLDGRFIVNVVNTNTFKWSPLDWDGLTAWDSNAVQSAESTPGYIAGLAVAGRDIWILKYDSTEVLYSTGDLAAPFQRVQGTSSNIGCAAPYSIATLGTSVFWLGGNKEGFGEIYHSVGYQPQRISTHAIEADIATYSELNDAIGLTYQQEGHNFYVISFQAGNKTWCFDITSGYWHQRSSRNTSTGSPERWRAISAAFFNGKNYVGDFNLGVDNKTRIYELDLSTFTDNGDPIVRLRSSPHTQSDLKRIFYNSIQFDMQPGVGLTTGQGSDPLARLRISDDGGRTWGKPYFCSIGKIGDYQARVKYYRLGNARDRVWELMVSDPVFAVVLGATVDYKVGNR